MRLRLTEKDIQILSFLGKYKVMLADDSKRVYNGKQYNIKRLKQLESERYIKRIGRYYIKLDTKGTRLVKQFGYIQQRPCRNKDYQDRVKEIVKIATLTLDSTIKFLPSSEVKESQIFTETSRKFIGELFYQDKRYITYYISRQKDIVYIRQVINDIQKTVNYNNDIIFIENFKTVNKNNQFFILGKESTIIIKPNKTNLERMRKFQQLDFYEILTQIYQGKEILLSNWEKADYMVENHYIVLMPFIDTEKLHRLNIFFNGNQNINRKIDIITLKENITKVNEILTNRTNIIELDNWLGGIHEEFKKV